MTRNALVAKMIDAVWKKDTAAMSIGNDMLQIILDNIHEVVEIKSNSLNGKPELKIKKLFIRRE